MQPHERITAALRAANGAGRTGLVPFITAGHPEPADFVTTLKEVASAGDVVELGSPSSEMSEESLCETHECRVLAVGKAVLPLSGLIGLSEVNQQPHRFQAAEATASRWWAVLHASSLGGHNRVPYRAPLRSIKSVITRNRTRNDPARQEFSPNLSGP